MTEQEIEDFNNVGQLMVEKIKDNFKDFHQVINNVEDLDVGYEYSDLTKTHTWHTWIELKNNPNPECSYGTSISIPDSEFGKTKFKTVREVEYVIADAIMDYVHFV